MSQDAVERMLGRIITDRRFRTMAGDSLEMASREGGYSLTPVELKLLANLEPLKLGEISRRLDPGLCRA